MIFGLIIHEPLPKGKKGPEANSLAIKMLKKLNFSAYEATQFIEWNFRGTNHYKWDKLNQKVEVSWDDNIVVLNLKNPNKSVVNKGDENSSKLIQKALDYFNNDSFWLVAPYKIFDEGTERRIVDYENNPALLITYTHGGSTPGDSYLWILDETGKPISFKMWVSIIPVGGLEASWGDWTQTKSGTLLPLKHALLGLTIDMGDVKAYN